MTHLTASRAITTGTVALVAALFLPPDVLRGDSWSDRADDVARRRLAEAHRGDRHAGATSAGWGGEVLSGIALGVTRGESASTGNVRELQTVRLASDAPESQPTEAAEAACAIERGPLPSFSDTLWRDIKEAPGLLWHDTKKVYLNPWNVVFLVGAGGASLALRPEVDDDIEDHYERHRTFTGDWPDTFGALGNPGTHFAVAGVWYLMGQTMQDIKTYEVGKRMFSALTITGLSTMLLKVSANTESPNGENLAWPSGHVSSTMAIATVLNDAYGPLVGVPMFGLTALVGIERLDDREHSFSDVVFGAALGWVVAETVMKEHRPEIFGGEIVPYVDPNSGNAGVAWLKTLGN